MRYAIILAGSPQEGAAYARSKGWTISQYRVATSANSIAGIRKAEVHTLASFEHKPNRHSILAALRYAPQLTWLHVSDSGRIEEQLQIPEDEPPKPKVKTRPKADDLGIF